MQPTIEAILLVTVLARPVGEVLGTCHTEALTRSIYRDDDSLESLWEADLIEHSANLLRCHFIFTQGLRPPGIEIRDDIVLSRETAHNVGHGCCCSDDIGIQSKAGHNDDTPALVVVGGFDEWVAVNGRGFEALQGTNTIVAAGESLKHEE